MLNRYKRVPDAAQTGKKLLPWLVLAAAAITVVIIVATLPQVQPGGNKPTGTMIDFETDAYKSTYAPQTSESPVIVQKGGSNAFSLIGSGAYNFGFPRITDGVYAGKTFGFTIYVLNSDLTTRVIFGTTIIPFSNIPTEKGAVVLLTKYGYVSMMEIFTDHNAFVTAFEKDKSTIFNLAEKMVFSFTMVDENTYTMSINGKTVSDYSGDVQWKTSSFSTFEFVSFQRSGTAPTDTYALVDDLHVSWT